jgi:moderate conductance mechanosensitive channel
VVVLFSQVHFSSPGQLLLRLGLILLAAVVAHIIVLLVRRFTAWLLSSQVGSITKARTLTRFIASVAAFAVWFIAVGFALTELGVPLQTYLASATIVGLAVSFGSQSLVQDVISGLTLISTGLINVGDMVDIGGQPGIVEKIGIRYTELRNVQGGLVFIPNRNVANLTRFPKGYIHAFVDVRLPSEPAAFEKAAGLLEKVAESVFRQFSGIMIQSPALSRRNIPGDEATPPYIRIQFRIWPGQGALIEGPVRQRIIGSLRAHNPEYQDWMVAVHYRVEPAFQRRAASALELFRQRRAERKNPKA